MKNTKSVILEALRNATVSEQLAVEFLERRRWHDTPACPRCGVVEVYKMVGRDGQRNKDFRWRCRGCQKFFTVRTGTIFEESRLPLKIWVYAFWKACSSKKGISALQLSREMEITHKSALFVLRRIRHGLGAQNPVKLTGTVEADEVYIGPRKPRISGISKRGFGTTKIPVAGIVQRDGNVRFRVMERLTSETLGNFIAENADLTCRLITDELGTYKSVGKKFAGGHEVVKHRAKQYKKPGQTFTRTRLRGCSP
jgi:transposase-like protein